MINPQTFFILGETSLAAQCIEYLIYRGHHIVGLFSDDPWLQEWAIQHKIPLFDCFFSLPEFDYLLSIVNPKLIPEKILQSAKKLAINYHDSPLPHYAGVHATSWALLNHEKKHGITWHVITEKIDAGDILKQVFFPIDQDETTFSLNIKCYQHALHSFKELTLELEKQNYTLVKQELSNRSYFGSNQKPVHGGVISGDLNIEDIEVLFRALDFGNYPNRFCTPKLFIKGNFLFSQKIEVLDEASKFPAGTVVKVTESQLQIATKTFDILFTIGKEEIQKKSISVGESLATPCHFQKLGNLCSEFSHHESFWVKKLQEVDYFNLEQYAYFTKEPTDLTLNFPHSVSKINLLTAFLIYLHRLSQQGNFTIDFQNISLEDHLGEFKDLFNLDLPLNLSFTVEDTFISTQEKITQALHILQNKQGFLKDLGLRYPALSNLAEQKPSIGFQFVDNLQQCFISDKYTLLLLISNAGNQCRLISSQNFPVL